MAARTHNDRTTVQAVWNAGGAQPPAGVPVDYGAEVARSHWWLYRQEGEDEAPGALPPGGVQGTYLEGLRCGFIWPKMVRGERTNNLKYCYACN